MTAAYFVGPLPSGFSGVRVSGTAQVGYVPTATSSKLATWQAAAGGGASLEGTTAPPAIASSSALGTASTAAHSDHTHALAKSTIDAVLALGSGVVKVSGNTTSAATIVDADVSSSAAIAYSKLSLAGSIVNADVASAAAIAGTKVSPNFGSQSVVTTGNGSFGSTPAAATGAVRVPGGATTQLAFRTNANTADRSLIATDASDNMTFGTTAAGGMTLAGTNVSLNAGGQVGIQIFNGQTALNQVLAFGGGVTAGKVYQNQPSANAATVSFIISAQPANSSSTSNKGGGYAVLQGGARTDTGGKRGGARLAMNGANTTESTEIMVECGDLVANDRRFLALCRNGALQATDLPSGDLVMHVGFAATNPSSAPDNGCAIYANATTTNIYKYTKNGHHQAIGGAHASVTWPSDANYTAVASDYTATVVSLSGGALTAQRNLVLPLTAGYQWTIVNGTSGGQAIQAIGATGSGVVIATGKTAIVRADGTNIVRVTADT